MYRFVNNVTTVLTAVIENAPWGVPQEFRITSLPRPVAAGIDLRFKDGKQQLLTLTNPQDPTEMEIVSIIGGEESFWLLQRGLDGTQPREWPVGTIVSARLPAGALVSFPQTFNQMFQTGAGYEKFAFASVPVLPLMPFMRIPDTVVDGMGAEVVQRGEYMTLLPPPEFDMDTAYANGSFVVPEVFEGHVYRFDAYYDGVFTPGKVPSFSPEAPVPFSINNVEHAGVWTPSRTSETTIHFRPDIIGVVVSEVGFIASQSDGILTVPTFSVEDEDGATLVEQVTMSGLTAGGRIHRVQVAGNHVAIGSLTFTIDTPPVPDTPVGGGDLIPSLAGSFYWKGTLLADRLMPMLQHPPDPN